jgi:hypothetical protein
MPQASSVSRSTSDIAAVACPFASAVGRGGVPVHGVRAAVHANRSQRRAKISWALKSTVLLLAGLYGFVLLALSAASPPSNSGTGIRALLRKSTWPATPRTALCSPSRSPFVCSHRSPR